jgi:hypothetical protein
MGQFVETEVKNNKGRADAVVKTADSIDVFEFKMTTSNVEAQSEANFLPSGEGWRGDESRGRAAEEALKQINSKDYAIPYIVDHRKLVKIGVEFSQTERGVKRWLIEE